jgi:hypothetical protein
MSKLARGGTREANKRRERHARKVWGEAVPSKAAHWFDHRTKAKRRDELEQRSLVNLKREIAELTNTAEPVTMAGGPDE